MTNFDEKSGVAYCKTPWGQWGQTIEEVFIEIDVTEANVKAREIRCDILPTSISVAIRGVVKVEGKLYGTVVRDESVWTLGIPSYASHTSVLL